MPVAVTDISLNGARIEHQTQMKAGTETILTFTWEGETITADVLVTRCKLERFSPGAHGITVYHSGIEFRKMHGHSAESLQNVIAAHIVRALEEQKANARGVLPRDTSQMPVFRNGVLAAKRTEVLDRLGLRAAGSVSRLLQTQGFFCMRYENEHWRRTKTMNPEQPPDGFTVSLDEDHDHVEMLCETYRRADIEGRGLIRLFAQLSITEGGSLRGRFEP